MASLFPKRTFGLAVRPVSKADYMAKLCASFRNIEVEEYPADWNLHGNAADPIRNEQMLVAGRSDNVIALPWGAGTANMTEQAEDAGSTVLQG